MIEETVHSAWELEEGSRAEFVLRKCGHDAELLEEVRALVQAREQADAWGQAAAAPANPQPRRFGAYRLEKMIGRGGMGAVYLASRWDGEFEQKVAVKIVGLPFELAPIRERFRLERQILASLNHPHIAHLIDGGVTEDGELYLAMEYVDGLPLDEYARGLAEREKLELFRQIAGAVAYAHQNLVVHRDLKPSNILVTAQGVVKLLDFGTAKLLRPEEAGKLTGTMTGFLTVAYASPEQLRGQAVSTLSDVYSLGAILYELMSGEAAFPGEVTARLEQLERQVAPRRLAGDMGSIVEKALDPEPERRYGSVEQLLEDVRRLQDGEPVLAHPPGVLYRAGKFVKRYRWTVGLTAVFMLGMAGATGLALYQAKVAREQAASARRLAKFASDTLIAVSPNLVSPMSGHPGEITLVDLLNNAAARVGRQFADDAGNEAAMRMAIGRAYLLLGRLDQAEPLLDRAVEILRKTTGQEHELAEALRDRCNLANFRFAYGEARRYCEESLAKLRRAKDGDLLLEAGIAHDLAYMMFYDGANVEDVEGVYGESARLNEKAAGVKNALWCHAMVRVGELRLRAGKVSEAEAILKDVLARMSGYAGPPLEIVEIMRALAVLERTRGNFGAAVSLWERALVVLEKRPTAIYSRVQFETELLYTRVMMGEAERVLPQALALLQVKEPDPEIRARRAMVAGLALVRAGRGGDGAPLLREAAEFFERLPANRAREKEEARAAAAEIGR